MACGNAGENAFDGDASSWCHAGPARSEPALETVVARTDDVSFAEPVARTERVGVALEITGVTQTVLSNVRPRLSILDPRAAHPAMKTADRELLTSAHRVWREAVLQRAGYRGEWVEHGVRRERSSPQQRLFADQVVERRDGNAAFDVSNGQYLRAVHHGLKTFPERARRMVRPT